MIEWLHHLENLSFLLRELGKQHLLISGLGVGMTLIICRIWRHQRSSIEPFVWATLFLWLALSPVWLAAVLSISATLDLPRQSLLGQPCSVPFYNRVSGGIPLTSHISWNMALLGMWSLGTTAGILRWIGRRRHFQRLLNQATPLDEPSLLTLVQAWRQRLGIRRPVQLKQSHQAPDAFTLGTLQPAIVLPQRLLLTLSTAQLNAVIGHELAHIKRMDDLWVRVEALVRALLWFNPFLRSGIGALRQLREIQSDQLTVTRGGLDPNEYARTLLATATLHGAADRPPTLAFGPRQGELPRRIQALLDPARKRNPLKAVLLTTGLLSMMTMALCFGASTFRLSSGQALSALQQLSPTPPLHGAQITRKYHSDGNRCHLGNLNHGHRGLDLTATGTRSVRAILSGEVQHVNGGVGGRGGYIVRVRHVDGFSSVYAHLEQLHVRPGDLIEQGTAIGQLSPNQYLHFEVHRYNLPMDLSFLVTPLMAASPDPGTVAQPGAT